MRAGITLCLLYLLLSPLRGQGGNHGLLDSLAIRVTGGSREFAYTNKASAFFYGETNGVHTRSAWQGFNVYSHEFLNDYLLLVDGKPLPRQSALHAIVRPDYLIREYPGGITEELHLVDSLALFAIKVSAPRPVELGFVPLFSDLRDSAEASVTLERDGAFFAPIKHLRRTPQANYPVWVYLHGTGFLAERKMTRNSEGFSPLLMYAGKARRHLLICAVGDTREESGRIATTFEKQSNRLIAGRTARMERLLDSSGVVTSDPRLNKAIAWATLSLDALVMHQDTKGIFAGLPWFNNYWGRDTFISLPGATLLQGRFGEAKAILRSFAAFQQTDSSSPDYGRIPNLVTTTDKAYNTADGTPRFVVMTREYIERSGDIQFLWEIYPTVVRSIEGTLRYHVDSLGFLTHGDAETWMDAVGPDGPWSPRGNRANDIQALWAGQLEAGIWCATKVGDARSAPSWQRILTMLKRNFQTSFVEDESVIDHLRRDGTKSGELRPNQIFTASLLSPKMRARVLETVINHLTYPYGVASLSQDDPNFHPYHQYPPYYPKDAAYHNGTVWTWLQGSVISELCRVNRTDLALELLQNSAHQILDRGAVGTQSELLDALPHPGEAEPRLSGTFSQAWNLAEYIRNWYDDMLGIKVNTLERTVLFHPRIPRSLLPARGKVRLSKGTLDIEARLSGNSEIFTLQAPDLRGFHMSIEMMGEKGRLVHTDFTIPGTQPLEVRWNGTAVSVTSGGAAIPAEAEEASTPVPQPLAFVQPHLRSDLRSLQGPAYPLIQHAEVKAANPKAQVLVDVDDPAGDDRGPGTYTYPRNANFIPGCFDLRHLTVAFDSARAYFTLRFSALSNPGWHPEYGFQLTYAVIAIDEDDVSHSGTVDVQHNAKYQIDQANAYERLIVIGGGVLVEDASGQTLAAYLPVETDAADPLGNADSATIRFAIPLRYLGAPSARWTFTVLSGGQDDHGGAGVGEFREVNAETGEWNGGGKSRPDGSNIYDTLSASAQK